MFQLKFIFSKQSANQLKEHIQYSIVKILVCLIFGLFNRDGITKVKRARFA